jgi:pimeloyl-ACP methyl ester carboxylesterase/DNA-binding winged helix-turn-helix (wHTH) protein
MPADIFSFADFELDRSAYQLRRNGRPLKVERIPLDLLFLLIDRRDQLVTREEILERIWGKGLFLDTDNAINSAIRKIRRALRDDPDAPRFVVTVPTKGYRFVAAVRERNQQPSQGAKNNLDDSASGRGHLFLDFSPPQSPAGRDLSTEASVKYARSGDVNIAYRVFGDGPRDMVLIPGTLSHVELYWEYPVQEYLLKRLTSFARVIVFDKRGQGLSDRVLADQTLDERIGDVRAVMDAAGSKCATVYGWSEGGPMSLMFAATYPERTSALVLYGTFASIRAGLAGWYDPEQFERDLGELSAHWGEGRLVAANSPSQVNNEAFVRAVGRLERASASPASIVALFRANYEIDVRHILPSIHLPTLVLHRAGDALVPVAAGRYLAEHIPGAKYVEVPGDDHFVSDLETQDIIADEIEEFITGAPHRPEPDRVLATVMFTYIVNSSERAAQMGDQRWGELLRSYYEMLRMGLATFRGREVKTTAGDGLLATFDGPARAIQFACSARSKVRRLGLQIRTGLHTGECELIGHDVGGIAVHIAAQVASQANPNQVLLSSTVKDLAAGCRLQFADRGMHTLNGVSGEWHLFEAQ